MKGAVRPATTRLLQHARRLTTSASASVVVLDDGGSVVEYERSFLSGNTCQSLKALLLPQESGPDHCAAGLVWGHDVLPRPYSLRARTGSRRGGRAIEDGGSAPPQVHKEQNTQEQSSLLTSRQVCTFGDLGVRYSYTGITRVGTGWPQSLSELRNMVESRAQQRFNFVFCNLYRNEHEYIGWHQDKEESIVRHSTIATVSLGASRLFCLRHDKTKHITQLVLEEGSILFMRGSTQENYRHSLPRASTSCGARLSLTFRLLIDPASPR